MHPWLAERTAKFDSSGIRKVFDLAAKMKNPINLSIGQPDFPVPDAIKEAAIAAIRDDKNGYSVTQGIAELRAKLQAKIDAELGHDDRRVLVTSGTSGALVLAAWAMVNPGDEVIVFDPYFVMYPALVGMVGGRLVTIDTYPTFKIDPDRVAAAITPRTKMILLNSPANPTGVVAGEAEVKALAELAAKHNIALISDEIYRSFCYDAPLVSPTRWNDQHDRRRRLQQDVRRHRLAAGLRARPVGDHRQADDAAAIHVRLRTASAAMGGRGGAGRRHDAASRQLQTPPRSGRCRPHRRRLQRRPNRAVRFTCFPKCRTRQSQRHRTAANSSPAQSKTNC